MKKNIRFANIDMCGTRNEGLRRATRSLTKGLGGSMLSTSPYSDAEDMLSWLRVAGFVSRRGK